MKTIDSILPYILTEQQETLLRQAGIINGIGGEGQNIEALLMANIKLLPGFDSNKAESFVNDMRKLSISHDVEYFFKLGFYIANLRFAYRLYKLLSWSPIRRKKFAIAIISLIILNRHGKQFYLRIN